MVVQCKNEILRYSTKGNPIPIKYQYTLNPLSSTSNSKSISSIIGDFCPENASRKFAKSCAKQDVKLSNLL